MIAAKDALRIFRGAQWTSDGELAGFVAGVGDVPASELAKWLSALVDDALSTGLEARLRVFAAVAERTIDPALFVPYVRALRCGDSRVRSLAASLVPRVNNVGQHSELCRLLGSADADLRAVAAKILVQIGGKAALDALCELVHEPSFGGRIDALNVMIAKAQHQAWPLVVEVLRSGRASERAFALKLLADARTFTPVASEAAHIALSVLRDADDRIVAGAAEVLATYATEDVFYEHTTELLLSSEPSRAKAVLDATHHFPTPRTFALLGRCLRAGPHVIRVAALDVAEQIGTDAAIPLLVEGLAHDNIGVRAKAMDVLAALGNAGRADPARAILWLLRSRDVNVRRMAVEVVNRVRERSADLAHRLMRHLRDEDWWVRERTMDALIEMKWPDLTRHLIAYLSDASDVVRRFAVGALRRTQDPAALSALLKVASHDEDWWVREEAMNAVGTLGDARAIPYVLKIAEARPELRLVAAEALVALHATDVIDELAKWTADDDPDVRIAALRAVASLGGPDRIAVVEDRHDDQVPRVRKAAREILAAWNVITEGSTRRNLIALEELLTIVAEGDIDDLMLMAARVPYVRKRGAMEVLHGYKPFTDTNLRGMIQPYLSETQRQAADTGHDVDFSLEMRAIGARFRVNLFAQATGLGAVFRIVKNDALLMVLENLGLPPVVGALSDLKDGLVILGGPTGAGKSTTLAALVERINRTSARHIVTIEDPIEIVHMHGRSLVTQREVGSHTPSFKAALRATLRQDPDIILVGEMRDHETMAFAVSAAETGHLVLATLHTTSAETSVSRLIGAFPSGQQQQVRAMVAASLRAVVCQNLLRQKSGHGRLLAAEILINNEAVANLIRKGKDFQLASLIVTQRAAGMQTMDHDLARLVREGLVEMEEAHARANDKGGFELLVRGSRAPDRASSAPAPVRRESPSLLPLDPAAHAGTPAQGIAAVPRRGR